MNTPTNYETPEILPGDLIECLETGKQGIIHEFGGGSGGHPRTWSITPLPGARIKIAWWHRSEFKVVQKGPAHEGWAAALLVQKEQDEQRHKEQDLAWVIANFDPENITDAVVITLLGAAGLMPDQTGLLLRGEIGIAALQQFEIFRKFYEEIQAALKAEDPKAALRLIGDLEAHTVRNRYQELWDIKQSKLTPQCRITK